MGGSSWLTRAWVSHQQMWEWLSMEHTPFLSFKWYSEHVIEFITIQKLPRYNPHSQYLIPESRRATWSKYSQKGNNLRMGPQWRGALLIREQGWIEGSQLHRIRKSQRESMEAWVGYVWNTSFKLVDGGWGAFGTCLWHIQSYVIWHHTTPRICTFLSIPPVFLHGFPLTLLYSMQLTSLYPPLFSD
jgi:hypothetical protein